MSSPEGGAAATTAEGPAAAFAAHRNKPQPTSTPAPTAPPRAADLGAPRADAASGDPQAEEVAASLREVVECLAEREAGRRYGDAAELARLGAALAFRLVGGQAGRHPNACDSALALMRLSLSPLPRPPAARQRQPGRRPTAREGIDHADSHTQGQPKAALDSAARCLRHADPPSGRRHPAAGRLPGRRAAGVRAPPPRAHDSGGSPRGAAKGEPGEPARRRRREADSDAMGYRALLEAAAQLLALLAARFCPPDNLPAGSAAAAAAAARRAEGEAEGQGRPGLRAVRPRRGGRRRGHARRGPAPKSLLVWTVERYLPKVRGDLDPAFLAAVEAKWRSPPVAAALRAHGSLQPGGGAARRAARGGARVKGLGMEEGRETSRRGTHTLAPAGRCTAKRITQQQQQQQHPAQSLSSPPLTPPDPTPPRPAPRALTRPARRRAGRRAARARGRRRPPGARRRPRPPA